MNNELDLDRYTDKEIVKALLKIKVTKFMAVMQALGAILTRMERRGKLIGKENSDEEVDDIIRRMFEN